MASPYFAPANDLGALSRYRLQDEAQNMAANASRRQYYTDLERVSADREKARQDAAVRMYGEGVRERLGMGDIGLRGELGSGDLDIRRDTLEQAGEQALYPYTRGMTPFQRESLEVQKKYYDSGGMFGRNRDVIQEKLMRDDLNRTAAALTARVMGSGRLAQVENAVAAEMDHYGPWYRLLGLTAGEARDVARKIVNGEDLPPGMENNEAVNAGLALFDKSMQTLVAGYNPNVAGDIHWDRRQKKFISVLGESPMDLGVGTAAPFQEPRAPGTPVAAAPGAAPTGNRNARAYRVPGGFALEHPDGTRERLGPTGQVLGPPPAVAETEPPLPGVGMGPLIPNWRRSLFMSPYAAPAAAPPTFYNPRQRPGFQIQPVPPAAPPPLFDPRQRPIYQRQNFPTAAPLITPRPPPPFDPDLYRSRAYDDLNFPYQLPSRLQQNEELQGPLQINWPY